MPSEMTPTPPGKDMPLAIGLTMLMAITGCTRQVTTEVKVRDVGVEHTFVITGSCLMDSWVPEKCIPMPDGTFTQLRIFKDGSVWIETLDDGAKR